MLSRRFYVGAGGYPDLGLVYQMSFEALSPHLTM